jgi:hypothetical protein
VNRTITFLSSGYEVSLKCFILSNLMLSILLKSHYRYRVINAKKTNNDINFGIK